jgi:hypothetical protein
MNTRSLAPVILSQNALISDFLSPTLSRILNLQKKAYTQTVPQEKLEMKRKEMMLKMCKGRTFQTVDAVVGSSRLSKTLFLDRGVLRGTSPSTCTYNIQYEKTPHEFC